MRVMVCPSCGLKGRVPDGYRKNQVRCPKCRTSIDLEAPAPEPAELPAPFSIDSQDDLDALISPPPEATIRPSTAVPHAPKTAGQAKASAPTEPWYYGFLEAYAKLCMCLMFLGVTVMVLVTIAAINATGPGDSVLPYIAGGVGALLIWGFSAIIATLFFVAFILLAVDVARNVRAIRLQGSRPES